MAKKQKIEFEFDFDESALSRAERRILEFLRKLSGASAKADEATRRRTAEWMAGPEGAAYRRQAPPGFEYDPIGASASQTYRSDKARQRFRAQQDYLRTGNRPGTSFTDQAMERLRNFMHDMPGGDTAIKTGKSAWGVAKGTLGVAAGAAGIGGIVSVISHAFSEYKSKIGDQETLFKRTGGSWTSLGQSIEELGKRVSVNAAEAGRLASSFQRLSGATDTGLIGRAGAAGSLARSLGMGPEAGVTALGRAEFMGFGGSEGRQRQFANLIGQTIADGNMLGSSEKVFEDILKHIQGVEENTGNLPSDIALAGFASLRAAMYDQNAAMKGAAGDSAVAKAQAFVSGKGGLWNEAFLARAFDKELRGAYDSAVAFDYLKGANMFDTVDSVFGNGSKETILSRDLKRLDLETRELMPGASELDILRRKASVMGMGSPQLAQKFLEAAEAAEKSSGFGAWAKGKFDFLQNPNALGGAVSLYQSQNDPEKLKALARQYTEGEHVKTSQADKDRINAAMSDPGQLAVVLQDVIAKQGEAGNAAEDLRDEVAKLNNTLTSIIGPRMGDLATNLAEFSNKFIALFNRVFGGGETSTNEYEARTRALSDAHGDPDGVFDYVDRVLREFDIPNRWDFSRDMENQVVDPLSREIRRIFEGIIPSAEASMDIQRYHNGGIAGMSPNEVPAILERGEIILPSYLSDQAKKLRGIRNNNPGNMDRINGRPWDGEVEGSDTRFASFVTAEYGIRAAAKNIMAKKRRGISTLRGLIEVYAPPSENDTEAYIRRVSEQTGISPEATIDLANIDVLRKLVPAIIQHENGMMPYTPDTLNAGIDAAVSGKPIAGQPKPLRHVARGRTGRLRYQRPGYGVASNGLPSNLITTGRSDGDVWGLEKLIAKHPDGWQAFLAATRNYPGKVRIHDAGRGPGETHNHQGFHAIDYELERLDKPGTYIPNYQVSGKDFRAYEQFSQDMGAWGEHHYPGFLKRFRAGLYFGPSRNGKYWSDTMHWDMNPLGGKPTYGDLINGAYPVLRERLKTKTGVEPLSIGMGDPEEYYRNRFGMEPLPDMPPMTSGAQASGTQRQWSSVHVEVAVKDERGNVIGFTRKPVEQPIAGNPATPGMRSQLAYGVP